MKTRTTKFLSLVIAVIIAAGVVSTVCGTSARAENCEDYYNTLYVLRPKISLNANRESNRIKYLPFGTELTLLRNEYDYCYVEDADGDVGYVRTGFIGYAIKMLWLTNEDGTGGVFISPAPRMSPTMYGYGACGMRVSERAIVISEFEDYWYIITEEGFSGYVLKYDPNIFDYWDYIEQQQEKEQEESGEG